MGGIPEEDESGGDKHEAEKLSNLQLEEKKIPRTAGRVEAKAHTSWKKVLGRVSKILLPCRTLDKENKELPAELVGCCSYTWLHWMTGPMIRAQKHGLFVRDLYRLGMHDTAKFNAEYLQHLWENEQAIAAKEGRRPSLVKCVLKFGKARFILSSIFLSVSSILQFLGPSLLLKLILDFCDNPAMNVWYGWGLVGLLFVVLLLRTIFFSMNFTIAIITANRVVGASQYLGFSKLLRLQSPSEATLGQFVTFCTGDNERISEAVNSGALLFGTPVMFLMSTVFAWFLVGPFSLLGSFVILLCYPLMGGIAALTSMLRLRVVSITDKRTTLMNEIVGAIQLIKMYAWEAPFQARVQGIRQRERAELQKAAFLQSVSTSVTPSITVIATIVTIIALTSTGFPLTAPVAFTLFSIFSALQFTVGTLPYALKCITEAKVSLNRLQKLLEMPEFQSPLRNEGPDSVTSELEKSENADLAVIIKNANFAWETHNGVSAEQKRGKDDKKETKLKEKSNKDGSLENGNGIVAAEASEKEKLFNDEGLVQVLNDIDLNISHGELIGISGHIGSGKSSLISAILGEMKLMNGESRVHGTFALVPQQAWIFNGTVRDNILFGSEFNQEQYDEVIDACALKSDFETLKNGDLEWIGEKGVNLSGGQKQRVSLARALYAASESSIFLLDDPLSAVDPSVAKEIFDKYIIGQLQARKKTIIFVSHSMQFLRQCDRVLFLKNGTIAESGTFDELMKSKSAFENLVSFEHQDKPVQTEVKDGDLNEEERRAEEEHLLRRASSPLKLQRGLSSGAEEIAKTLEKTSEEQEVYEAGWAVMLRYFKACGGYFVMFILFMFMFLFALVRLFTAIWLQIWMDDGDGRYNERIANATFNASMANMTDEQIKGFVSDNPNLSFYQMIYAVSLGIMMIVGIIKAVALAIQLLAGSSRLHDSMLKRVLHAPMSFFDVTPGGKILNRFSKDMDELDVRIPFFLEFVTTSIFFCVTQISLACIVFPYFVIAFFVIIVVFSVIDLYMNRGVSMTKRLENETKTAILHDISSMMPGIPSIRAFEREHVFQEKFNENLNRNLSAQGMFRFSIRWFALRMDLLGTATIVTAAAVAVASRGHVTPAQAGLALSNVFQVATFITFVMMLKAEFRARFNSVERVCQYANDLPQEAPSLIPERAPPSDWPQRGEVRFEEVSIRYREDLPLVLRNISFRAKPGQKIGIVGRTAAGKSSLFGSLLRLTELSDGKVIIDGVDVSKIGLTDLRSAVAVIPQDPVLFQGTIRYNLDPFNRYDDAELWTALEKAHLKEKILASTHDSSAKGLDLNVESGGENFSVGEKQLICLARALLRGNKILLLDEATASVDLQTDFLIQTTIREAFASCTVFTIAHRINTILNYDRVLVMRRGKIIEEGPPNELIKMKDGAFASMLAASKDSS